MSTIMLGISFLLILIVLTPSRFYKHKRNATKFFSVMHPFLISSE